LYVLLHIEFEYFHPKSPFILLELNWTVNYHYPFEILLRGLLVFVLEVDEPVDELLLFRTDWLDAVDHHGDYFLLLKTILLIFTLSQESILD